MVLLWPIGWAVAAPITQGIFDFMTRGISPLFDPTTSLYSRQENVWRSRGRHLHHVQHMVFRRHIWGPERFVKDRSCPPCMETNTTNVAVGGPARGLWRAFSCLLPIHCRGLLCILCITYIFGPLTRGKSSPVIGGVSPLKQIERNERTP